jgi:hypothetical protein
MLALTVPDKISEREAYCIRYGLSDVGFFDDHSRPLQPMISASPASAAVGKSQYAL